jgi:hypothetical protein
MSQLISQIQISTSDINLTAILSHQIIYILANNLLFLDWADKLIPVKSRSMTMLTRKCIT